MFSSFVLLATSLIFPFFDRGLTFSLDDCPASLERDPFLKVYDDHCYQFVLWKEHEFLTAEKECKQNGGTLATVKAKEINQFIVGELKDFHFENPVWIGLTDRIRETQFLWSDGGKLDSNSYSNWAPNEGPRGDNSEGLADCVKIDPNDGKWYTDHCSNGLLGIFSYQEAFVCQFKVAQ